MRASIRRSASTSASAQNHSIVVVAGRMVRGRPTNLRTRSSAPVALLAEPVRHRRASRSASRCGRANRADLCQTAPASRRATAPSPLDLQRDALRAARVDDVVNLYHDFASGLRDDRPGLDSCLRVLRKGDVRVVWKLDRLGRNLAHLVKHRAGSVGLRGGPAGARRPGGADRHHDRDRTGSCSASSRRWPSSSGS